MKNFEFRSLRNIVEKQSFMITFLLKTWNEFLIKKSTGAFDSAKNHKR